MAMDARQLVKGRVAEALVEAVLLDSEYRVVRAGRESQVQATFESVDSGHSADFVVWRRVESTRSGRALHDVVVMEVKYRGQLEKWLPDICERLVRQRGGRRSELHVVLVTDRPDAGRSCFQFLRLGDYVPGQPPPTRDLHEADLGIDRATIEKYEPFVRALFEAVRNVDRKPGGKLPAREPLVTGGAGDAARLRSTA
jgi:hypothetical protein